MDLRFDVRQRLSRLVAASDGPILAGARKGLEKESLRVRQDGYVAETPHPRALGSALTHPFITTDYSEALVELITPPFENVRDTLAFLGDLHTFVWSHLGDELLWATSMPCMVDGDESVPIAEYGTSNAGRMKRIYRVGLGHRYGRIMQAIAGVHFNYSLPITFWHAMRAVAGDTRPLDETVSEGYFALLRNFHRHGWVIPLLFGSSPAVCKTYLGPDPGAFELLGRGTWYLPHATSLRMSDIGYKNENQAGLEVSYDDLEGYVRSLTHAIETPYPAYEAIGVVVDGEYRQLNANILQIENEYYSFIRPKQVARSGEKPTLALMRRGVQYVEVRALDLDPFAPLGVSEEALRFVEALLVLCVLGDSPPIEARERAEIARNQIVVAREGRGPGLTLSRGGAEVPVREWLMALAEALEPVCDLLDAEHGGGEHRRALEAQVHAFETPGQLPAARMLDTLRAENKAFFTLAMELTRAHRHHFAVRELPEATRARFDAETARSHAEQKRVEASDGISFERYLERYLNQARAERQRLLG